MLNTHVRDNLVFLKSNPVLSEVTIAAGSANVGSNNAGEVSVLSTGSVSIGSDVGAVYVEAWGQIFTDTPGSGNNNWAVRINEASAGKIAQMSWFKSNAVEGLDNFYLRSQDLAYGGTSRTFSLAVYASGARALLLTTGIGGVGFGSGFMPVVLRVVRSY